MIGPFFCNNNNNNNNKAPFLCAVVQSRWVPFDFDDLIDNAMNSAFWNGGQNCSANMRQIVHKKVKDEFLDKIFKKVNNKERSQCLSVKFSKQCDLLLLSFCIRYFL